MRHTVTYDSGGWDRTELERIYDRLRKASWRHHFFPVYHLAYIHGVKDALNAVKDGR